MGKQQQELILASSKGDIANVQRLLDEGVDPNSSDTLDDERKNAFSLVFILDKTTPILEAVKNGHTKIVKLLLERGADPETTDKNNIPIICIASHRGHLDIVRTLLETKRVDIESRIHKTPLMYAIENGHKNVAELLLGFGANPDTTDMYGYTPLMHASEKGNVDLVELLVKDRESIGKKGANIYIKNRAGLDAFEIAVINSQSNVIEFFLTIGIEYNYDSLMKKIPVKDYDLKKKIFDDAEAKVKTLGTAKLLEDNHIPLSHKTMEELVGTLREENVRKESKKGGSNKRRGTHKHEHSGTHKRRGTNKHKRSRTNKRKSHKK